MNHPIPDSYWIAPDAPTREHMAAVLDYITSEINAARPVYVHSLGGIGRTGTGRRLLVGRKGQTQGC